MPGFDERGKKQRKKRADSQASKSKSELGEAAPIQIKSKIISTASHYYVPKDEAEWAMGLEEEHAVLDWHKLHNVASRSEHARVYEGGHWKREHMGADFVGHRFAGKVILDEIGKGQKLLDKLAEKLGESQSFDYIFDISPFFEKDPTKIDRVFLNNREFNTGSKIKKELERRIIDRLQKDTSAPSPIESFSDPDSYFSILGVDLTAFEGKNDNEIKSLLNAQFRKLAVTCHPDMFPGDRGAEEKFKSISNARDVLSDPVQRAAYRSKTGI